MFDGYEKPRFFRKTTKFHKKKYLFSESGIIPDMCLSPDDISDNLPIWPSSASVTSTPTSNVITYANVVLRKTSSIDSNHASNVSKSTIHSKKSENGTKIDNETHA